MSTRPGGPPSPLGRSGRVAHRSHPRAYAWLTRGPYRPATIGSQVPLPHRPGDDRAPHVSLRPMVAARRTGAAFATSLALLSAAAMVPASVLAGEAPSAPEWSYEDPDGPGDWGSLAPEYATCDTGVEQSPVDIPLGAPVLVDHVAFSYVP